MRMREAGVIASTCAGARPESALAVAILETAADIVVVTDELGMLRYANAAAGSLLGYDPAAIRGTSVFDLIHPEDLEHVRVHYARQASLRDHEVIETSYRVARATGAVAQGRDLRAGPAPP